jgi:transposase
MRTLWRVYMRAGELTPVWVPDKEQEAMRDLTRAREDMKAMESDIVKQRLGAFLLRHGKEISW